MNAWQIVLLVVVIVVVLAVLAWAASRRQLSARREQQARAHLNEARERQARAESTRAAADEKAAQLRREAAELEQRMAQQERESAQLTADAERDQARAAELEERARKLAPHLSTETSTGTAAGVAAASAVDGDGYPAGAVRDSHAGVAAPSSADRYYDSTVRDADAVDTRRPATEYRHTEAVTDPDGTVDPVVDDGAAGRDDHLDRDAGPDGRESGLRRLKDRLTGRVDERDGAVEDRDVPGATPRRP